MYGRSYGRSTNKCLPAPNIWLSKSPFKIFGKQTSAPSKAGSPNSLQGRNILLLVLKISTSRVQTRCKRVWKFSFVITNNTDFHQHPLPDNLADLPSLTTSLQHWPHQNYNSDNCHIPDQQLGSKENKNMVKYVLIIHWTSLPSTQNIRGKNTKTVYELIECSSGWISSTANPNCFHNSLKQANDSTQ